VQGGGAWLDILWEGRLGVEDQYPYIGQRDSSGQVRLISAGLIRPYLVGHTEGRKSFELPDSVGQNQFQAYVVGQPLPLWLAFDIAIGSALYTSSPPFPGWILVRDIIPLSTYQNLHRPAYWLFGGGAQFLGEDVSHNQIWDFCAMIDKDAGDSSAPLDLYAQELWTSVTAYPDAGDVFGMLGGSYGRNYLPCAKILRGGVDGIVGELTNIRYPDVQVKLERQSDNQDGGSGTTNDRGFYETGNPYGHDGQVYKVTPQAAPNQSGVVTIVPRYRQRRSFKRQPTGEGVSYDVSSDLRKARAFVDDTIRLEIAQDVAATVWHQVDTQITGTRPAIRWERKQVNPRLWITYEAAGKVYAVWTRNEGRDCSMPLTVYDSGPPKWPKVILTQDGRRFHYWRDPGGTGRILGKCYDAFDNLMLPVNPDDVTFTAIASDVDDEAFDADEHTQGMGAWRMHLIYRSGGQLIDMNSPDGINFS